MGEDALSCHALPYRKRPGVWTRRTIPRLRWSTQNRLCIDLRRGQRERHPVSDDYDASGNEFSGRVDWVQIDLGEDADHLISPQERLQSAMARQ